jgi:hypothetical protein
MSDFVQFPPQQLPNSKKTEKWRKQVVDWASNRAFFNYELVRKSVVHKKINYDLLKGKLHMRDLELLLNPEQLIASYIPDKIQHYPIINSKINLLLGEEYSRPFDFRVIVTNPTAISEIEENKKAELLSRLQEWVTNNSQSEDDANQELEKISDYFTYEWQDMREVRANALINHYAKEYNLPVIFNSGFYDAMAVGEEIYQCDIVGGEPVIYKLDPMKVRIFKSGTEHEIEKADIIIIEDYWSPGRVIDTFGEYFSKKDWEYLNKLPDHVGESGVDSMSNIDERYGFLNTDFTGDEITSQEGFFFNPLSADTTFNNLMPYDIAGNLRVLRVFWKSRRRIKKVKSYDPQTGEEVYTFYPDSYVINKDAGEEEQIFYINEAWEGTKIGSDIYVNMRPKIVQYNRISNPSRCHFGIVGSIYTSNGSKPFSLVDMMKPYSYMYDVIHDRLNKAMAKAWGKLPLVDLAKIPKGWTMDKWLYYAKVNGIAIIDSFKEGSTGAALGKLAGGLNNASSGVIDATMGDIIQQYTNLLEFIKLEMSEISGITKQREGQISNRETVGGVERATLQSSHSTEWLWITHEDVKKRAIEVFIETAKAALKGRNKKFQYILSDGSQKVMEIDGDEFCEADYGLIVDGSNNIQDLNQKLETLGQAALQNQLISFSTMMKMYTTTSLAEKQRMVEKDEQRIQEQQQQAQQQQLQQQQQQAELESQAKQAELQLKDQINQRDNETKILIAELQAANDDGVQEPEYSQEAKDKLMESMRQFDARLKLDRDRLNFDERKAKSDAELKRLQINKSKKTTSK